MTDDLKALCEWLRAEGGDHKNNLHMAAAAIESMAAEITRLTELAYAPDGQTHRHVAFEQAAKWEASRTLVTTLAAERDALKRESESNGSEIDILRDEVESALALAGTLAGALAKVPQKSQRYVSRNLCFHCEAQSDRPHKPDCWVGAVAEALAAAREQGVIE